MAIIAIQLANGEQDGYRDDKLDIGDGSRPYLIYIWHTTDDTKMREVKGDARRVLADKLGVLAYRYQDTLEKPEMPGGLEYLYVRYPRADKKLTSA